MAEYYLVKKENDGGGCIMALVFGLIILALIIYLMVIAFMVIVGIILAVSAIIGTVFTLKNLFKALGESISICSGISKPNGWIIPNFVYKFVKFGWETVKALWRENFASAKSFFANLSCYRVVSIKFWISLVAGISVIIFGTVATWLIYLFYQAVTVFCVVAIGLVLLAAVAIFCLIGLCVAVALSVTNYMTRLSDSYASASGFIDYIANCAYSEYFGILRDYWSENVYAMQDKFADAASYPMTSVKKWFYLGIALMLAVVGSALIAVYAVLHIVIVSLLFIVIKPISLIRH